jgi:uncharacterized membrane protein
MGMGEAGKIGNSFEGHVSKALTEELREKMGEWVTDGWWLGKRDGAVTKVSESVVPVE